MKSGAQKIHWGITPKKEKERENRIGRGTVRPQCRFDKVSTSLMRTPEQRLPIQGVPHWVEMA